jgi:hypothetical protein
MLPLPDLSRLSESQKDELILKQAAEIARLIVRIEELEARLNELSIPQGFPAPRHQSLATRFAQAQSEGSHKMVRYG